MLVRVIHGNTSTRTTTHTNPAMPITMKEPRQVTRAISQTIESRRERVAEPRECVRDPLREAALHGVSTRYHGARRGRQRGADTETHQNARSKQRREIPREARQHRRACPTSPLISSVHREAKTVGGDAADDLKKQVGVTEDAEKMSPAWC